METRLPPLAALRAFEAAARLESFSRAAGELHVTHGAVSHQVRALEEFLGAALFARNGRRVVLTADGRLFADRVRAALREIGEAAESFRKPGRANRLTVSLLPSFAARWLMPRIGRFMAAHPEITMNVHTSITLVDFERDEVDLAIRFGNGDWPKLEIEKFMDDEYFPVASPRFNRGRLPAQPAELARLPLISSDGDPWAPWFKAAGLKLAEPAGPIFHDLSLAVQAAIDARGIALVRRSIAEGDLAAGTLMRLFDVAIPASGSYYLVRPRGTAPQKVLAFRAWMLQEKKRKQ
jgi:LysR family transcriptional regulator, glycine cleavage system transcriptional activator